MSRLPEAEHLQSEPDEREPLNRGLLIVLVMTAGFWVAVYAGLRSAGVL